MTALYEDDIRPIVKLKALMHKGDDDGGIEQGFFHVASSDGPSRPSERMRSYFSASMLLIRARPQILSLLLGHAG
jgi:hypothetical protein